jgi:hypothetical protein
VFALGDLVASSPSSVRWRFRKCDTVGATSSAGVIGALI